MTVVLHMAKNPVVRCAIYTRKSSDEGLEQTYNSLAAQRDACEAFILSQKQEGWVKSNCPYDDGGYSGGNLDRPGLQRLLKDMENGDIDTIVVYKIDRLTRSLRDFAKLAEFLEKQNGSFVAVTQQFNTATSMGRLTLNVLLTFAQFEREVAADRIRDKHTASRRLGIWMGGNPALGYDVHEKKLVINHEEAETVRHIYQRFVHLRSMARLRTELSLSGIVSKQRIMKDGSVYGGVHFTWHPLHKILTNPLYRGMTRHKKELYPGQHPAIIGETLFAEVQVLVAELAASGRSHRLAAYPSLLKGILFDMAGERLYPTYTPKKEKNYRYYVSSSLVKRKCQTERRNRIRVSAPALEQCVVVNLAEHLRSKDWVKSNISNLRGLSDAFLKAKELAADVERQPTRNTGLIHAMLNRVEMDKSNLRLSIRRRWFLDRLAIRLPKSTPPVSESAIVITIDRHQLRCGREMKAVVERPGSEPEPDHRMIREILRAIRWFDAQSARAHLTIMDLAEAEGFCPALISNRIRLAFLAPDIVEAILAGSQPKSLTISRLRRACPLPLSWAEQRQMLMGKTAEGLVPSGAKRH
jgi:site-specific DNA recombinase